MDAQTARADTSVFQIPNYRFFWIAKITSTISQLIMVLVIGWLVYDIARATMNERDSAFLLGMVGLAQFLPLFTLTLVVAYVPDTVDRPYLVRASILIEMVSAGPRARLALQGGVPAPSLF